MGNPAIKVLLVEDNFGDARLVKEMLAEANQAAPTPSTFNLTCVERLSQALAVLAQAPPDIVLVDLSLPDSYGLDTVIQILQAAPRLPVVVMSGYEGDTLALQAVQSGAQDYLVKGHVDNYGLERTIRYAIERKHAEDEIRQLNADLERRVRERTAQLEMTNRELEAFSHSVSHDLHAPLVRIQSFCQILETEEANRLTDKGRFYLQRIQIASQRMEQLIESLLRLARLSRSAIRRERVDLSALAQAVADELRQTAPARPVKFSIAEGLSANADPNLLRTVLENLLGNAWKFTAPRAETCIEVGCLPEPPANENDAGGAVYFVRDNGVGFSMAQADKVFIAFQRLHAQDEFPGNGVGLATVQRIIQRHGGRVWTRAEVDEGATFYFTLGGPRVDSQGAGRLENN